MRFSISQHSRPGARPGNEDRAAYCYSRDALLMVVADGMGGHEHGEIASNVAVQFLVEAFRGKARPALADPAAFLAEEMSAAHRAIVRYAEANSLPATPRTTCVACVVQGGHALWAHAGDSRLYHLRAGRVEARTRDHSHVQRLVDSGRIREEAVPAHPERNRIFNCLGSSAEPRIELSGPALLQFCDVLLLCSDGLWGPLPADMIAQCAAGEFLGSLPALFDAAEARAGRNCDNLTAVAMVWGEQSAAPEADRVSTSEMDERSVKRRIEAQRREYPQGSSTPARKFMSDEEIERAIAEIRSGLRRNSGR